jgi:hypothetical protein
MTVEGGGAEQQIDLVEALPAEIMVGAGLTGQTFISWEANTYRTILYILSLSLSLSLSLLLIKI